MKLRRFMPRSFIIIGVLVLALPMGGWAQGTTSGRRRAVRPGLSPVAPARNSAQALEMVARMTYDAFAGNEDLRPYIEGVMTAFGVPPLSEADASLAAIRFSQGLPLMFFPQVAEMADAFNDGGFVTLDSFIAAANDRGAKQKGTTEPLTRDYLTQKFAAYTGKTQYGPGQALPAFIVALGRERARRSPPKNPDSLWGDGLLDPLQLTLLLYSVSYAGAGPLPPQFNMTSDEMNGSFVNDGMRASSIPGVVTGGGSIVALIADALRDQVTGEVQDVVGIPLDKSEAAQVSVCASLLLYGHKLKVKATPNLIYHKYDSKPSSTRADATLTFEDDYWDNYAPIQHWVLENLDCKLPRKGTVGGKPLDWSVSDALAAHGNYDVDRSSQTDVDGHGFATWKTVDETTPKALQTFSNQRDAVGALIVRAGNLVPGWSGLERVVGALKDTGNTGDSPLTVIYYIWNESWTGTGSSVFPGTSLTAQVTWTVERVDNNISTLRPSGTATAALTGCTISPSSGTIVAPNGVLFIDYNVDPPTYHGSGEVLWPATLTCPPDPTPHAAAAGGLFLGGSKGTLGVEAEGTLSIDGTTMEGSDKSGEGTITWKFTRDR